MAYNATPQEVVAWVEDGRHMLNASRDRAWLAMMVDELPTCCRLSRLGDPEPLRRWCELIQKGRPE